MTVFTDITDMEITPVNFGIIELQISPKFAIIKELKLHSAIAVLTASHVNNRQ